MSTVVERGEPATAGRRQPNPNARAAAPALPVAFHQASRVFGAGPDRRVVLRGIDIEAPAGSIVALLGPSGCGKSTLLRIAGGLDRPSGGQVTIGGDPVRAFDPRCAVAFQEARLLPWRSVRANVAIGLPRGGGTEEVDRLIELVGLREAADQRPRQISGGMAQRASLARALARRPGVLLLDEPFGALDALTRIKMQDLLLDVHRSEPVTVLLVTHDVDEAVRLADTVVVLGPAADRRPGSTVLRSVDIDETLRRDPVATAELRDDLLDCLGVHRH
ncbi:ABC transporter ATP-binding protein [Nakamurella lactea]|uniref:ABC transporter ATP-binding protein n=1 Tax=Nakamurella lactea TaxID=459515 RepID=UPI00040265D2|nr:ABC transporter ATP-binding protein [Nakamurella lactea]